MWNKPHLLSAIADLLILVAAAALLAASAVWLVRVPSLPVRQVVFAEALQHTRRIEVEQILPSALKGNFFSLNLEMVRGTLEKLPWVRRSRSRSRSIGRPLVGARVVASWSTVTAKCSWRRWSKKNQLPCRCCTARQGRHPRS